MNYGPNRRELQLLARQAGCRVHWQGEHGGVPAFRLLCDSHAAKVDFLRALMVWASEQTGVVALASMLERRWDDAPAELLRWVQAHEFREEPEETFQHPLRTVELGYGDCDDLALLYGSLAMAMGYDVWLDTLEDAHGNPVHVAPRIYLRDGRQHRRRGALWAETTMRGAELGEHPLDAAARLGLQTRPDLVQSRR